MELFMMNCELLAACSALGYLEEDKYYKEPDCLDTIKCLIHYLQEDNNCTIRIQLHAAQIVINDLIPILVQYENESELFNTVLRLLVNMTKPVTLCLGKNVPSDVNAHYQFMSLLSANQDQKEAFSDSKIWLVLAQKLYNILEKPWEERNRDDNKCLEGILVLVRNLLYTPGSSDDDKKTGEDTSSHDKLIIAMHIAGLDNLITYIAGSQNEKNWCLHILEIVSLLVKEHEPENIVRAGNKTEHDRKKIGDELASLRSRESIKKTNKKLDSRHSRFGSTFVVKGVKALKEDRNLILHKSVQKSANYHFDEGKQKLSKAKNRRPLIDTQVKRHSTFAVRKVLRDFCMEFIQNSYNSLMRNAKSLISSENSEEHDESYFFWVMNFFMDFNRRNECKVDLVSETIQLSCLHFINVSIINYYEMMITSKDFKTWGRRIHLALRCYKEFLLTIEEMTKSEDPQILKNVEVLMNTLFYIVEYREIFLMLLSKFDERKQTRNFLIDVVHATHLFIKLFKGHCGNKNIVVQKKVNVKRKRTAGKQATSWKHLEVRVISALGKSSFETQDDDDLINYISEMEPKQQQEEICRKMQTFLVNHNVDAAINILNKVREAYPDLDYFGLPTDALESNLELFKRIFMVEFENPIYSDEGTATKKQKTEVTFSLNEYLKKFADPKIMNPYMILFTEHDSNSQKTNHYVITMLYRVAYELKMYGIFFNASMFKTMQKIMRLKSNNNITKELIEFSFFVVERFFQKLSGNKLLLTEILFKRNSVSEVYEITEGYGTVQRENKIKWSEENDTELVELYNKYKHEEGVIESIMENISDESKTRKQICNRLKEKGCVDSISQLKSKGKIKIWRQSHIDELVRLFEEYKATADPVEHIKIHLTTLRSRQSIMDKIVSLNLVSDRKALYKKRPLKPKKSKDTAPIVHIGGSDTNSDDDQDDFPIVDRVKQLQHMGYTNLIAWLKENLEQALDDRKEMDASSLQPIPLVPLTEDQESALLSSSFKKLLHAFCIERPSDQEMFWRIPTKLSAKKIEQYINALSGTQKRKRSVDLAGNASKMSRPVIDHDSEDSEQ